MSTNQPTNKNNKEPSFDEYLAYEELRMIFVIAIETQNFETLEARIAAWEKRYPLAEFTDEYIIRKIKAILDKDFLSRLLGDYLAAKILHEQEKQKEAYDSLKQIIDKAKKTKDYKLALRDVRKWKDKLHSDGLSLYDFDRFYRAKVCTLLLLPSKELENQAEATYELKKLKENSENLDSKTYFEKFSNWQNKYSISEFPDKLKKEINQITTDVLDSISQKRNSENAIVEIEAVLLDKDVKLPLNTVATILSKYDYAHFPQDAISTIEKLNMQALSLQASFLGKDIDLSVLEVISPTETQALVSIKDILNKTPHDMDAILNWMYVNRKINYSEFARENIVKLFSSVGYKIPKQASYSIPEIEANISYSDTGKVDDLRKDVILNYLGILSQGNILTIEGKDNLVDAHTISTEDTLAKKENIPVMFLEAYDTVIDEPEVKQENQYDENGELTANAEEETIYNIFIEDIIDNPLGTYSIPEKSYTEDITSVEVEKTPEEGTKTENEGNHLSNDDLENLEQAYELSTYIVVASPLLEQALTQKKERSRKFDKGIERIK